MVSSVVVVSSMSTSFFFLSLRDVVDLEVDVDRRMSLSCFFLRFFFSSSSIMLLDVVVTMSLSLSVDSMVGSMLRWNALCCSMLIFSLGTLDLRLDGLERPLLLMLLLVVVAVAAAASSLSFLLVVVVSIDSSVGVVGSVVSSLDLCCDLWDGLLLSRGVVDDVDVVGVTLGERTSPSSVIF